VLPSKTPKINTGTRVNIMILYIKEQKDVTPKCNLVNLHQIGVKLVCAGLPLITHAPEK